MSTKDDGGPAFPPQVIRDGDGLLVEVSAYGMQTGMTLRDYFAAKAMQGFATDFNTVWDPDANAVAAYKWADAMLRARETS